MPFKLPPSWSFANFTDAAAWDRATHRLSLRAWLDQEAILILANDEENRAAIDTINQLLFKRLSELVLARGERPEASRRTTWFLLDEVRQAGRLDGLSALMTKGRSKGAAVLLGFQDIHGLHEVYGRETKRYDYPDERVTLVRYVPLGLQFGVVNQPGNTLLHDRIFTIGIFLPGREPPPAKPPTP